MPAEGLEWVERDELLSFEEIARLVRVLAAMGVDEVRLTGGEPLVRRDLAVLVRQLSEVPGVGDLSLTTPGPPPPSSGPVRPPSTSRRTPPPTFALPRSPAVMRSTAYSPASRKPSAT